MSLGYFDDLDDAEDYYISERLETSAWDELEDIYREKVVKNAYNRLYYDPRWELPTYAEATPAELIRLKKANGEMAYYLAQHLADEDRRVGLQAQGVRQAGIVKEAYSTRDLQSLPVPPFVEAILEEWKIDPGHAGILYIERDEEE